jgi:hypothetical protein
MSREFSSGPGRAHWIAAITLGLAALLWRWRLTREYCGHEEEDWGNLVVIREVLSTSFRHVDSEHMPLFSWLAAALTPLLHDPERGGEALAMVSGALAVAAATWLGQRWLSPGAGLLAGLLLCLQPESALYSATPLREPLYTALALLGVAAVGERRGILGGLVLSLAFLARFNAAFTLLPALLVLAAFPAGPAPGAAPDNPATLRRPALLAAALLACTVLLWATYYASVHGTFRFWAAVAERNAGDWVQDLGTAELWRARLSATAGVLAVLLPLHLGFAAVPLSAWGAWTILRPVAPTRGLPPRSPAAARWLLLAAAGTLALLLATAWLSTYPPGHNLYWKWLTPLAPLLLLLAAQGATDLYVRLLLRANATGPDRARAAFRRLNVAAALLLALTLAQYARETRGQVARSRDWYGGQVELARAIERLWPADSTVVADLIPAGVLLRKDTGIRVLSWSEAPPPPLGPEDFARWLLAERVALLFWFREDWVGAAARAPQLAAAGPIELPWLRLVRVGGNGEYGWSAWRVEAEGAAPLPALPPLPATFLDR